MNLSNNENQRFNQERIAEGAPPIPPRFRRDTKTIRVSSHALRGLKMLAQQFTEGAVSSGRPFLSTFLESVGLFQLSISIPKDEIDPVDHLSHSSYQTDGYNDALEGHEIMFGTTYQTKSFKAYSAYMRGYFEGIHDRQ